MILTRLAGFYAEGEVERMLARRAARCPTAAMADARDVAYAALFLASDEARYTELVVDGGLTGKAV